MRFIFLCAGLSLGALAGCNHTSVNQSAEARRACMKELNDESIHSADDFMKMGYSKRAIAEGLRGDEQKRVLYCAIAAFESASFLVPLDPDPLLASADAYSAVGNNRLATAQFRKVMALKPAAAKAQRQRAEEGLRRLSSVK